MKILFVRPRYDNGFGMKPVAIAALSAIAKSAGHQTALFDTGYIKHEFGSYHYLDDLRSAKIVQPVNFERKTAIPEIPLRDAVYNSLESFNPDIVAISVIYGQHIIAGEISRYIKDMRPNTTIIWGGPGVTVAPAEALDRGADFVCVGEGLIAFKRFIGTFAAGGDLSTIDNIWLHGIANKIGPLQDNLDELPFLDWDIFRYDDFLKPYNGEVLVGGDHMITWGCPNRCAYCINGYYQDLYHNHGHQFRLRRYSVDRIIKELKYKQHRYSIQLFKFCDENFLLAPLQYLEEFADKYASEIGTQFTTACHPKSVTKGKIELLRHAGCVSLSIGIESGNQEYRKSILNRTDSELDIERAFALASDAGIRTMAFNMIGLPFYTRAIYDDTVELNRRVGVENPTASFFYPFKGTKLRMMAIENGFYKASMDRSNPHMRMSPSLINGELSTDQLKEMFNVFALYVKMPMHYHRFIRRSEKMDIIGSKLREELLRIFDEIVWNKNTNHGSYLLALEEICDKYKAERED